MSHEEILTRAINKAVSNGWDFFGLEEWRQHCGKCNMTVPYDRWDEDKYHSTDGGKWHTIIDKPHFYLDEEDPPRLVVFITKDGRSDEVLYSPLEIIFDHSFARAFFGEEPLIGTLEDGQKDHHFKQVAYQLHLMRMVLADDPIVYLAEYMTVPAT